MAEQRWFYVAYSWPVFTNERWVEVVEDIEAFPPDLLAKPSISRIRANTATQAALQYINDHELHPDHIVINLNDFFAEYEWENDTGCWAPAQ